MAQATNRTTESRGEVVMQGVSGGSVTGRLERVILFPRAERLYPSQRAEAPPRPKRKPRDEFVGDSQAIERILDALAEDGTRRLRHEWYFKS